MNAASRLAAWWFLVLLLPAVAAAQQEWPMVIRTSEAEIVIYQPQPEQWQGDSITARAAIGVTWAGEETPVFGAIWIQARMRVDRMTRLCSFEQVRIPILKFPETETEGGAELRLRRILETEIPRHDPHIELDRILASLELTEEERALAEEFSNEPPAILYRRAPAILVLIDGEPQLQAIEKEKFDRVINTPFFIIRYRRDRQYYLFGDGIWFSSSDLSRGWAETSKPPSEVVRLGRRLNRQAWPDEPVTADDLLGPRQPLTLTPEIIVSTRPAELIVTRGEPAFSPIEGTRLLFVANTESQIFLDISSQNYYLVLSGRWYRSPNLNGPWEYVAATRLPADFARIPEGSEKDVVLAYVPGTKAAHEALIDAQAPQTARVDRRNTSTEVTYDGEPRFEAVPGADMEYAVNTAGAVLRVDGRYYCVDNGIWFQAANPYGPWLVAVERPRGVERIPPRCPAYNVKYVYIYDYTPDWVYVGYTPGYLGSYVYGPTIVYGTGYWYRAWYRTYYFPRHWTWGFHVQYNPWWGWSLGCSWIWGDPYTWYFPPYWGQPHPDWWVSGGWWGPTYYRPPVYLDRHTYYGPRTEGGREIRPRPSDVYDRYPDRSVRPDRLPATRTDQYPTTTQPQRRPAEARPRNDVYSDPTGEIYRRDPRGEWEKRQNGEWNRVPADQPKRTEQLDRYSTERQRGAQRTETYKKYERSAPPPPVKPKSATPAPRKKNN